MKLIYLIWYPFPYKYYLKLAIRYSCTGVAFTDPHLHENQAELLPNFLLQVLIKAGSL